MMRFALEITLGDDGMLAGMDIADALREVADLIEDEGIFEEPLLQDTVIGRSVLTVDGTACGQWAVQSLSFEQAARRTAFTPGDPQTGARL